MTIVAKIVSENDRCQDTPFETRTAEKKQAVLENIGKYNSPRRKSDRFSPSLEDS